MELCAQPMVSECRAGSQEISAWDIFATKQKELNALNAATGSHTALSKELQGTKTAWEPPTC